MAMPKCVNRWRHRAFEPVSTLDIPISGASAERCD